MILDIKDLWTKFGDYIEKIKEIIIDFYNLILSVFNFFPSPFKELLLTFLILFLALIIRKIVKG